MIDFVNPQFMIILSQFCQANCLYCFSHKEKSNASINTLKQINEFIKNTSKFTNQSSTNIIFHGGEPLIAPKEIWEYELEELNRLLPKNRIHLNIQSNLWNLDSDFCNLFLKYSVSLGTSLDGPQAINDLQRGKGYFSKTYQAIKLAEKYNLTPGIIATFTPLNIKYYKEIFRFFADNHLCFSIHGCVPSLEKKANRLELSPEQYSVLLINLLNLYISERHSVRISSLDQICYSIIERESDICNFRDCLGMFLAFDTLGYIYPCQRFCGNKEYAFGNVTDCKTIDTIRESRIYKKILQRQKNVNIKCGGCEHYLYCKGGCLYDAWSTNEDVDPYCDAYKKIFSTIKQRLIEEMQSNENIEAIIKKPYNGCGHPLLRKGALIEISNKKIHPKQKAENAIKIISLVELAKYNSTVKTLESLNNMGFQIHHSFFENIQRNFKENLNLNNLYIHLTLQCQLRCNHCYANAENITLTQMNKNEIIKIIIAAKKLNFQQVIITGGEPTLYSDFVELLKTLIIIKKDLEPMRLALRTNFVKAFSEEEMNLLSKAFIKIVVSIDGDEEYHDVRRGKGSYMKSLHNIEKYQKNYSVQRDAAILSLACVIHDKTKQEHIIFSVQQLARKNFINKVQFRPVLPIGRALDFKNEIVSTSVNSYSDLDELLENGILPINSCGIGQNLYILPDGDTFPCYAFCKPHSFLGNVNDKSIETIINSDNFKKLSKSTVDTNPKCGLCKFRYICGGACRAWGGNETQFNLDSPPTECEGLYNRSEEIYEYAFNYLKLNSLINVNSIPY